VTWRESGGKIMADPVTCFDNPTDILKKKVCVNPLSKNLKGTLTPPERKEESCAAPPCKTLKTIHRLKVEARVNRPCDTRLAGAFSGTIVVERLITAFDQDGMHRGVHAGDFEWFGSSLRLTGRISGLTNEGTHRLPVFTDCQPCDARGVMEGRLCGQVVESQDPALKRCQVVAAYRIKFDPSVGGGSGAVTGVLEGVIICACQ
jgi:hypothetical protein